MKAFQQVVRPLFAALCMLPLVVSTAWAGSININTASAEELAALDNIGQVKAEAIVEHREAHGPFESVQALTEVSGIGERTVEVNLDRIEID